MEILKVGTAILEQNNFSYLRSSTDILLLYYVCDIVEKSEII